MRVAIAVAIALLLLLGFGIGYGSPAEIGKENSLGPRIENSEKRESNAASADLDQRSGTFPPVAPVLSEQEGTEQNAGAVAGPPTQQQTSRGITVSGSGTGTVPADVAVVEFHFGRFSNVPPSPGAPTTPGTSPGGGSGKIPDGDSITEAELQLVIDALVVIGIARDDIEFLSPRYDYDPYFSDATLRVTVRNLDILGDAVGAATDASATLAGITLQSTYTSYRVEDCGPLEEAALSAAVEDAERRALRFSSALGVTKGNLIGASTYSHLPLTGFRCDLGNIGPMPVAQEIYSENRPREVELYANVVLTYEIQ